MVLGVCYEQGRGPGNFLSLMLAMSQGWSNGQESLGEALMGLQTQMPPAEKLGHLRKPARECEDKGQLQEDWGWGGQCVEGRQGHILAQEQSGY